MKLHRAEEGFVHMDCDECGARNLPHVVLFNDSQATLCKSCLCAALALIGREELKAMAAREGKS